MREKREGRYTENKCSSNDYNLALKLGWSNSTNDKLAGDFDY